MVFKATRQPFAEGEGDRGRLQLVLTLPLRSPQALTSDPRGGEHLPAGCCKTPPENLPSWPPRWVQPPSPSSTCLVSFSLQATGQQLQKHFVISSEEISRVGRAAR